MKKIYYLYAINFISAFLLFQIELIIAKIFLPKFGGSYMVWGACIVFFQFILLLGYLYSHFIIKKIGTYKCSYLHFIIILLPLLLFPGRPLPEIISHSGVPLVIDIFLQLSLTIGLAFFVLSTISIVTQSWLAHSQLPQHRNPFMLYAVSNIGSFIGLLSYPFIFEAFFDLDTQITIWRILYLLFILLYLVSLLTIDFSDKSVPDFKIFDRSLLVKRSSYTGESIRQKIYWVLLSAAGCILFLSVTNVITYEIAPCPLLWIIPLCIYLASFVLTFREKSLYPQWITNKFHLVMGFSVLNFFFAQKAMLPILLQIIAFIVSLFALCMFCQLELYESRPKKKDELTVFYLLISFGGFAGSLFVTWLAPLLFTSPYEFLFGLFIIGLSLWIKQGSTKLNFYYLRLILYVALLIVAWPLVFEKYNIFGFIIILLIFGFIFKQLDKRKNALCICLLIVMILAPFVDGNWSRYGLVLHSEMNSHTYSHRNYYGLYQIIDVPYLRIMYNGNIPHGAQNVTKDKKINSEPLCYYHRNTPVGKVLSSNKFATNKMGVIGLGVGTLSAYGKKGEEIDFFELDPDMSFIASSFDFLHNSQAKLNFFYKDARIALREAPLENYDILVVDAFSGDSVPVHLLTTDAIREYKVRMKDKGIILFHITNRYLNLAPVLFSNAKAVNAFALIDWNETSEGVLFTSEWVALTWDYQIKNTLISQLHWKEPSEWVLKPVRIWTDKYSNVLSVFELKTLLDSIKQFNPFLPLNVNYF